MGVVAAQDPVRLTPLGLDEYIPVPDDNPLTPAKMGLGERLFFDTTLSADGRVSCASCHDPGRAFTSAARRGGLKEFWRLRLQYLLKQPHVPLATVAAGYVQIGDHDSAITWLERLYAERGGWIRGLKVRPMWDPLRSDPRFQDLLRRAKLAD